ncbi:MAG: AAA family ATPase [Prolixibacteraceae bacterium]
MSDIFHDYMSKRLDDLELSNLKTKPGPVITFSRLAGCSSPKIASELAAKLNSEAQKPLWKVISKEVLHEAAQKLQLEPKKIKTIFKSHDRSVLDDIMQAFLSKDYQLEKKMRNTVLNVIRNFAIKGHIIIVGRGSSIICSDIENALHVRIVAPLEWRIHKVMSSKKYNHEEAVHCIDKIEKERSHFRQSIKGKLVHSEDFDLTINQSKYNNDEIIEIISAALRIKNSI